MKKLLICCMCLLFTTNWLYASVILKTGYLHTTLDNASDSWYKELAYDYRWKDLAGEVSVGHFATKLRGRENIWVGHWEEGDWKNAGTLTVVPLMGSVKYYYKNFFIGAGGGIALMDFQENYAGVASVKNRLMTQAIAGYNINDKLSLEIRGIFADLDIESGSEYIGISEDKSHLRSWLFCLNYKF